MRILFPLFVVILVTTISGCKKESRPASEPTPTYPANSRFIDEFVFRATDNPSLMANDSVKNVYIDTLIVTVPYGTNITSLIPTIKHTGASISPSSGVAQDFSVPVKYVVTARDGSTLTYWVIVKVKMKSTVFASNQNGNVYAIDGDKGTLKWTFATGATDCYGGPTYYNGTVYFGATNGYLYALDANTGALKWRFLSNGPVNNNTPCINNDILYFTGTVPPYTYGSLYAINAQTGSLIWNKLQVYQFSNPTVSNSKVFVTTFGGVYAYDALTGTGAGVYDRSLCRSNPLVVNGIVYSGTEGTTISAFNIQNTNRLWDFFDLPTNPDQGSGTSPTHHNGTIFNASYNKRFYAVDSASGLMKWRFPTDESFAIFSAPIVGNGMVYTSAGGYIYALNEPNGLLRWKKNAPSIIGTTGNTGAINCTLNNETLLLGAANNVHSLNALNG